MKHAAFRAALGFAIGFALFSAGALADKTITYLKAGSEVTSINFDFLSQPGKVVAKVCGRAPLAAGGFGDVDCAKDVVLTSGAVFTAANNLATGQALGVYQADKGL